MIKVKYSDDTIKEYETFEQISDGEIVISIDCSNNELTQLPENMNFPNLQELNCSKNQLTQLPENMNFLNLQILHCVNNDFSQQIERIIYKIQYETQKGYLNLTGLNDYNNTQNIHNVDI